jgi:putative flippase GtrA
MTASTSAVDELADPTDPYSGAQTADAPAHTARPLPAQILVLDVTIPVYNEERDLGPCVRRLHAYLTRNFPYRFQITVADNASTDATLAVALALSRQLDAVRVVHLDEKGRGRALRTAWGRSSAMVLAYMDVDLSTDLAALLPLVAPLISGHSQLAIGTRLGRGARIVRGTKREFISRCYNLIVRGTLGAGFSDAQCGFKAIRRDAAVELLPFVEDTGWFFDTELLVLAERAGLRIHEVPVDWIDDPDSRVDIVSTAIADLKGLMRIGKALGSGALPLVAIREQLGRQTWPPEPRQPSQTLFRQVVRFGAVGVASTLAYIGLFSLLRNGLGAQMANFLALLLTAIANTAANRRFTFGVRGRDGVARHHLQALAVFALGLALTAGPLGGLGVIAPHASRAIELAVLVAANVTATVLRFVLLRGWVFGPNVFARSLARSSAPSSATSQE